MDGHTNRCMTLVTQIEAIVLMTESDRAPEDTHSEEEDKEDQAKIAVIGRLVTRCGRE